MLDVLNWIILKQKKKGLAYLFQGPALTFSLNCTSSAYIKTHIRTSIINIAKREKTNRYLIYIRLNNMHEKLLDSDWLRAVQFFFLTMEKGVNSVQK